MKRTLASTDDVPRERCEGDTPLPIRFIDPWQESGLFALPTELCNYLFDNFLDGSCYRMLIETCRAGYNFVYDCRTSVDYKMHMDVDCPERAVRSLSNKLERLCSQRIKHMRLDMSGMNIVPIHLDMMQLCPNLTSLEVCFDTHIWTKTTAELVLKNLGQLPLRTLTIAGDGLEKVLSSSRASRLWLPDTLERLVIRNSPENSESVNHRQLSEKLGLWYMKNSKRANPLTIDMIDSSGLLPALVAINVARYNNVRCVLHLTRHALDRHHGFLHAHSLRLFSEVHISMEEIYVYPMHLQESIAALPPPQEANVYVNGSIHPTYLRPLLQFGQQCPVINIFCCDRLAEGCYNEYFLHSCAAEFPAHHRTSRLDRHVRDPSDASMWIKTHSVPF